MRSFILQLAGFLLTRPSVKAGARYSRPVKGCSARPHNRTTRKPRSNSNHPLPIAGVVLLLAAAPAIRAELGLEEANTRLASEDTATGWQKKWAVQEGFSVSIDTEGYQYPTAIAFVPNPGSGPKDPLYFVTELRGKVKVVTNDRTVYTFAEGFLETEFDKESPTSLAEFGLAGICLEPAWGYVFVTFAYQDEGAIRNNIVRFETTPRTFALKPKSQWAFTEVFAPYESGVSHQIGQCQISNGMLYAGIGDGWNSHLGSQKLDTLQGKVIRMTLDGKPVADNPFYEDDDILKARNYIWAYGMRNPFGLEVVDGRVMVAENGVHVDRFLQVRPGRNYLWSGSDWSIAANADYVFFNAVGPVQMDHYQLTAPAFPAEYRDEFFVALSSEATPGIMRIPYGGNRGRIVDVPSYFLRSTEDGVDFPIVGLAFGPDGLYFAPILPVRNGQGAVMKIQYDPPNAHSITMEDLYAFKIATADRKKIIEVMHQEGCFGCHRVAGVNLLGGTKGPMLGDSAMVERLQERLSSPEYLESLQALDARDEPPFNRFKQARDQIVNAEGRERVRLWVKYQILEPRFDGPLSAMPNLGVSEAAADAISHLLVSGSERGFVEKLQRWIYKTEERRLATTFGAGALIALPGWFVLWWLARLVLRRRRS